MDETDTSDEAIERMASVLSEGGAWVYVADNPYQPADVAAALRALAAERAALWEGLAEMIVWFGEYPKRIPSEGAFPKMAKAIAHAKELLILSQRVAALEERMRNR
jgi:hypothetical protein